MPAGRPPIQTALGRAVKARRAELGITQEELADRSGGRLARSYISGIEIGAINPSTVNAQRLAEALGLSLSELFGRAERLLP